MMGTYPVVYQETYGDPPDPGGVVAIVACTICQALILNDAIDRHRRWHRTLTNLPDSG